MKSLPRNILSILIVTEFALGNFANGFIALVNCTAWIKRQKISCADGILTALAVSRIALLSVFALQWYAAVFNPALYSSEIRTIVSIAWAVSSHFTLWLATSLSILYLLKIANFSSPLFLRLKWKAKKVVLTILWGTLVFLVCNLTLLSVHETMMMNEYERNITWKTNLKDIAYLSNMILYTLENFLPFAMSVISFLLLIFSLWKHLKTMQLSGKGTEDPSTRVHVRAVQTVISFLLLFVVYFLAQVISVWKYDTLPNNSALMLCQVLGILYPSIHSCILIWGNKKLRQAMQSFLWQLRCWGKKGSKWGILCF